MQQHAIDIHKVMAAMVLIIGLGYASGQARAQDTAPGSLPAQSAADGANARPVMVKAVVAGGLRPGAVMKITPGRAEILNPALPAKQVSLSPNAGADACVTF